MKMIACVAKRTSRSVIKFQSFSNVIVRGNPIEPDLLNKISNQSVHSYLINNFFEQQKINKISDIKLSDNVAIYTDIDSNTSHQLSFQQTHEYNYIFANILKKLGIKKNDCVGLLSPNSSFYFSIFLGISLTGAFSTTINPALTENEIIYQLDLTKAKVLIAHSSIIEKASIIGAKLRIPVISYSSNNITNSINNNIISLNDLMKDESFNQIDLESFSTKSFDSNSLLTVPFSSGTTGRSKGVKLSHKNILSNLLQIQLVTDRTSNRDKYGIPLPFYHIYGMVYGLYIYTRGCPFYTMQSFDFVTLLKQISTYKLTSVGLVPPIILALAKHPVVDNYDLSSLEFINSGAAPLGKDIQNQCMKRLKCFVRQGYGLTELSPVAAGVNDNSFFSDDRDKYTGSCGRIVNGCEAKIVNAFTGEDLPYTSEGEIMFRGPNVMLGYYNDEKATAEALTSDGWLRTGDIGYFNDEKLLFLTDRSKELIKYKGLQVPPAELEAVIIALPEVKDVVVIPVLDEEAGEIPRAYVVVQDNIPESDYSKVEQTILNHVKSTVAYYKHLRGGVKFTKTIPRSPAGKILRRIQIQIDRGEIA